MQNCPNSGQLGPSLVNFSDISTEPLQPLVWSDAHGDHAADGSTLGQPARAEEERHQVLDRARPLVTTLDLEPVQVRQCDLERLGAAAHLDNDDRPRRRRPGECFEFERDHRADRRSLEREAKQEEGERHAAALRWRSMDLWVSR